MSKSWQLYRVSPLWHFKTGSSSLSSYSQQLSGHLQASPTLEANYIATITPLPRFGLDGSTALKICIHRKKSQSMYMYTCECVLSGFILEGVYPF